jgi:ABC-type phosphate/phosphonate transport system substrate-binding protein
MYMRGIHILIIAMSLMGIAVACTAPVPAKDRATDGALRIGIVRSLFHGRSDRLVEALMDPFRTLLETQTGMSGKLIAAEDSRRLGQWLAEDQVELGIFHGIEFAWARQRHPDLRPLTIAVSHDAHLRACLLVRADEPARKWIDLKGQRLAVPQHSREHCQLFLKRRCKENGGQLPRQFFSQVASADNAEEALDDVVDGAFEAAIVDKIALQCYRRRKPARAARLRVIDESEIFPASVIAYHSGALDGATLKHFHEGLVNARNTALGQQLLTLWKLTGFEAIPTDYEQTVRNILKVYPPPEKAE